MIHSCLLTIIPNNVYMCNAVGMRVTDWQVMNITWYAPHTAPEAQQVREWAWRHWRRCSGHNSHSSRTQSRLLVFVSAKCPRTRVNSVWLHEKMEIILVKRATLGLRLSHATSWQLEVVAFYLISNSFLSDSQAALRRLLLSLLLI